MEADRLWTMIKVNWIKLLEIYYFVTEQFVLNLSEKAATFRASAVFVVVNV
jgi:hypothetical protein